MRRESERRSIFRRGKGRALLRFLIGELVLFIICSVGYLCLLYLPNGGAASPAPVDPVLSVSTEPTPAAEETQPPPAGDATETPAATEAPPETGPTTQGDPATETVDTQTQTPLSDGRFSQAANPGKIPKAGKDIRYGMVNYTLNAVAPNSVSVEAYAYIGGADAAASTIYLALCDADGKALSCYQTGPATGTPAFQFAASEGQNLDRAYFAAAVDLSALADGDYMLGIVVANGGKLYFTPIPGDAFCFTMKGGQAEKTYG